MRLFLMLILAACAHLLHAQEFIPLWPAGKMPNSIGLKLQDSIANERVYRVGTPGMYAFLPSQQENKGAAILICPGGGYERLAYMVSGFTLAKWFNTMGIAAFVLNYRLPNSPDLVRREIGPLQDAQRALRVIRSNAAQWGIAKNKIGIQGSSAGGHLAALTAVRTDDVSAINDGLDSFSFKPDFAMLVSPVIDMGKFAHGGSKKNLLGENPAPALVEQYSLQNQVTNATPPVFLVHAHNDKSVAPQNSILFYQALLEKNVNASLHIFPQGGHAIAVRNNPGSANHWTILFETWLQEMNFISEMLKK